MTKMLMLATLLGVGCAAKADRPALAPTAAVAIAPDLTVTCASAPPDRFAYDPTASRNAPTCPRLLDDDPQLELDEDAPAPTRARAVTEFLAGAPADPPVD